MKIGTLVIGPEEPCRIVAEIGNAHNGDYDRCVRLVTAAHEAGADAVKFQAYTPEELVVLRGDGPAPAPWGEHGWTMYRLYERARTPLSWFPRLVMNCEDLGVPWFASVFGPQSLMLMEALDCPAYKLAALDYGKRSLLRAVRETGKPLLRSCAHPYPPRADDALLLYCPPGYPQADPELRNLLHGYAGFSYHGTDPRVPMLAATLGAQVVECHVQLDDEPSELEAGVSLTMAGLAQVVDGLRCVEAVC